MVNTYEEALNWMLNRTKFGIIPGLQRMEEMLMRLGNPHHKINAIHVAGTNGKGSTIEYLQNIFIESNLKVGVFSSPSIIDYREQIMYGGEMISKEEFLFLVNKFIPIVEEVEKLECGSPTEFEIITAMSFYYFGERKEHDIFLVEVGLGGLEDCTNLITPLISIITSIGHDHHQFLGNTIEEITKHKAGIIKRSVPVITAELKEEALNVIRIVAKNHDSDLYEYRKQFNTIRDNKISGAEIFTFNGIETFFENVKINMIGEHQIRNASCALMAIEILMKKYNMNISFEAIKKGLEKAQKVGRLECISNNPYVLIDGAHNVEGIASLVKTIKTHYPEKEITILFSALRDKEVSEMIKELVNLSRNITMTTFDFPRAMSNDELVNTAQSFNISYEKDYRLVIEEKLKKIRKNGILLITGSLYFISNVRKYFVNRSY